MNRKEFGAYLKAKREKKGYSQQEAAHLLELSPQFLSQVEKGGRGFSMETAIKFHVLLGVEVEIFFNQENANSTFNAG